MDRLCFQARKNPFDIVRTHPAPRKNFDAPCRLLPCPLERVQIGESIALPSTRKNALHAEFNQFFKGFGTVVNLVESAMENHRLPRRNDSAQEIAVNASLWGERPENDSFCSGSRQPFEIAKDRLPVSGIVEERTGVGA